MLEYGFNELDNDFVTLWSKKIVSGEDTLIFRDLTKLAELGQINAIQSWYLIAQRYDNNEIIDKIVKNLGSSGANELLSRANKNLFDTDAIIGLSKWWSLDDEGFLYRDNDEFRDLTKRLRRTVFCCYSASSIEGYYDNYETTRNPLMLERFYEMMNAKKMGYKNLIQVKCKASSTEFRKLRKTLLEMYENDKNNVAVAFALGKNLTLFKANAKLKALGSKILTDLSNRELSQTLQDYEVKGTKRLIKQQIAQNAQVEENLSAQDRYVKEVFENVEKVKQEYGISFGGNHRKYISPNEYTIISQESKQAEEMKYRTYVATPEEMGIDKKGGTTVIKPEITEDEVEQSLESVRKHDTENGKLL